MISCHNRTMARKRKRGKVCCIVDQHCTAPAGWEISGRGYAENDNLPKSLPKCSVCGRDVCRNCSYIRDKVRHCADCFVDKFGEKAEITVLARMYRLAGYNGSRELAKARMRGELV